MSDYVLPHLGIPLHDGIYRGDGFHILHERYPHRSCAPITISVTTSDGTRWEGRGRDVETAETALIAKVRRPGPRAGADALCIASITESMRRRSQ